MGTFSLWHWVIVILISLIYFIPIVKVLNKAGYSGWWSVLALVPLVNVIMFWVFAFADWPSLRGSEGR
jgi:uncharacterized membrane protein YhaH (DUF805 family)